MSDPLIKLGTEAFGRQHIPQKHPEGYVLADQGDAWTKTHQIWSIVFFVFLLLATPAAQWAWNTGAFELFLMAVVFSIGSMIGLGILGRHWLKTRKLTPGEIVMPNFPLRLGEDFRLHYRRQLRQNQLSRPGEVSATLRAYEQVSYQVGTDTRTETATVWEQKLPKQEVPAFTSEIAETYRIQIPQEGPTSFEGKHNALRWEFKVTVNLPGIAKDTSTFLFFVIPEVAA